MVRRSILSTSALAAALLFQLPAIAQETATAAPPQDDPSVPQAQGDGFAGPGDIVVTARRRSETAQEVPIAISVLGAAQIESTGNFNINKLQQLTPTLQVYSSNPRNTFVNIRGIGAPFGLTSDGFEQGVGIYVDDV